MNKMILALLLLTIYNSFAGVGGSAGGDINIKKNIESLEYYLPLYNINIPQITFDLPDSSPISLAINDVCFRNNETIESLREIQYDHLDPYKKPDYKIKEILKRDRKYLREIYIPHLFKKSETIYKEDLISKVYDIKIWRETGHAPRLIHTVQYTIKDCE